MQRLLQRRWQDWLAVGVFGYLAYAPLRLVGDQWAAGGSINWYLLLLLLFYLLLIGVYLLRPPPQWQASGWMERYFPLAVTFAPAAVLQVHPEQSPPAAAVFVCCAGIVVALWGLLYLRGNFSIMVEGRELVTKGPYRWLRHPIYLGEIITLLGLIWISPHWITVVGAGAIIAGQLWRARLEECKLHHMFGSRYDDYSQRSWWFHRLQR